MRILVFAYACEPDAGSEPGAGWMLARMLSCLGEVWVITRANNAPVIEAYLGSHPEQKNMHFVYVDLPRKLRFWKRGNRGVRLYYFLWQVAALRAARRLKTKIDFDLIWHLTLANIWLGSLAPLMGGPPFIYGPVGGGIGPPWSMLPCLGARGAAYELARGALRTGNRFLNPFARLAWRRANLILAQNPETRDWIPSAYRDKVVLFQNAIVQVDREAKAASVQASDGGAKRALFAGRLLAWKGAHLAIRAVVSVPDWELSICGTGPDEARLRQLVEQLGAGHRVRFMGSIERRRVIEEMHRADVFLFPSLHDDAPLAVVEAVTSGLPVICVDRGGPPLLAGMAGIKVPITGGCKALARSLREIGLRGNLPDEASVAEQAALLSPSSRLEELRALLIDRFPQLAELIPEEISTEL